MNKKNIIILIFFVFCLAIFGIAYFLWQGVYSPRNQEAIETQLFLIEEGKGVEEIAINLENQGLIKCQYLFKFYVLTRGVFPELQAGVYSLSPSMSISKIVNKITAGDVFTKRITIPEGFNIRQIERRFSEAFNREMNFLQFSASDFQDEFNFLKDVPRDRGLEGFLFPDTYQFSYLVTEEEIIREMLKNFDRKLTTETRKEITQQGKTIFDIVIMASLLEEEVREFEDKKIVSGIFWRRIEINMPLQVDATIVYILEKKDLIPEQGWTFQEMRREVGLARDIDSLYNTYMYKGLPIGPISNPGMNSILAAVYPKNTNYLFFLSTPEGETIFSRTLQKHNIAKKRYFSN